MNPSWRFIEAAPDAMVITDGDGTIVLLNQQAERMFGYTRKELVGQKIERLIPERAHARHVQHRAQFRGGPTLHMMARGAQLSSRRKDGTELPVEVSLNQIDTHDGRRVVASIRDVSERVRMEAAAHAADDLMRQAVEIQEDAFAVFDRSGALMLHNSAFRSFVPALLEDPLSGRTVEEIVEATAAATTFESDEARRRFREHYRAAMRPEAGTDPLLQQGRSYRVTRRRTRNLDLVVTIADRTEDEARVEALRRASKAKTEFLSAMSHELRTPLHAILGFASLLIRDRKTPLVDRQKEMVQHILKGCDHLTHLVDDVLDLFQIESGRMTLSAEPVELATVFDEVIGSLRPAAARAGITVQVRPCAADLPPVYADRTRIAQVLVNYGTNAIKYGRRGGHATFSAAAIDGGFVRLALDDDGVGIVAEKQAQVFQPFQRAGQEMGPIEGIGIGLALSQRLAILMDGRVGFRSAPNQGSTFWLDLRAHRAQPPAAEALPATAVGEGLAGSVGPNYEVVYVEDSPANVVFLRALLAEYERVTLHVASSAEKGLELVSALHPQLVILDLNLPGMSGFEAARRLKEQPDTRDIPVVALSATAIAGERVRAAGFDHHLTRPIVVPVLLDLLEKLLVR